MQPELWYVYVFNAFAKKGIPKFEILLDTEESGRKNQKDWEYLNGCIIFSKVPKIFSKGAGNWFIYL